VFYKLRNVPKLRSTPISAARAYIVSRSPTWIYGVEREGDGSKREMREVWEGKGKREERGEE